MESFPFTLSLNYKMEIITIKPPLNFTILQEVICEKYDLNLAYIFYTNEEGIQYEIKNDLDYSNFLIYATDENLNEIELYIRSDEQMSQQRKLSLRKRSAMRKSGDNFKNIKTNNKEEHEDYEIGIQCDYDYYGDIRNRKGMIEKGYNNHNFGFKERKRIYYIKQKKDMQREEQMKNMNNDNESQSSDEGNGKKNKKRKLKNKKKKKEELSDEEVEEIKSKKQGKKGRVMIKGGYRGGY